jgi:dTDP-glucose 4,6-dehydratase
MTVEDQCKIKTDVLRPCSIFGPRQSTQNFIPKIIKSILENQPVVLEGQGQRVRDWLYIEDFCSALILLLNNRYSMDSIQTCNVSAGYEFSDLEIFHEITKSLGQGAELLNFDKQPLQSEKMSSYPSDTLTTGLGWKPGWKVRAAIAQTCNWYLNNKWFLNV